MDLFKSVRGEEKQKTTLEEIIKKIKTDTYKNAVDDYRNLLETYPDQAQQLKQNLPAFTPAGTFNGKRSSDNLEKYSGIIHLDFDKLTAAEMDKVISYFKEEHYTHALFVSPSNNGVKVFFKTDRSASEHESSFNFIRSHYNRLLGIESDKTIKDIARCCFVSYDPEAYYNESALVFNIASIKEEHSCTVSNDSFAAFAWENLEKYDSFCMGNRSNFVFKYACSCNRLGVSLDDTIKYALQFSVTNFKAEEITKIAEGVYDRYGLEHGSTKLPNYQNTKLPNSQTPVINEQYYAHLPVPLREACMHFKHRDRDIFLTGTLSVLSAAAVNISGLYGGRRYLPNLFSFVAAPPASGKGNMKYARDLAFCISVTFKEQYSQVNTNEDSAPATFFIPANTSASMLKSHLESNEGKGVMFSTEARTLFSALKQDFGNFEDDLLKAFQNEEIEFSRKQNFEYIKLENPCFSVCLSGVHQDLHALIKNKASGLLSRFLIYTFDGPMEWKSPFKNNADLAQLLAPINDQICSIVEDTAPMNFRFTQEQELKFDAKMNALMSDHISLSWMSDVIPRTGLIAFKIAMLLTRLREKTDGTVFCADKDFDIALYLATEIYFVHAKHALDSHMDHALADKKKTTSPASDVLPKLNNNFTRKEFETALHQQGLAYSDKTISNFINRAIDDGRIKRRQQGKFEKIE